MIAVFTLLCIISLRQPLTRFLTFWLLWFRITWPKSQCVGTVCSGHFTPIIPTDLINVPWWFKYAETAAIVGGLPLLAISVMLEWSQPFVQRASIYVTKRELPSGQRLTSKSCQTWTHGQQKVWHWHSSRREKTQHKMPQNLNVKLTKPLPTWRRNPRLCSWTRCANGLHELPENLQQKHPGRLKTAKYSSSEKVELSEQAQKARVALFNQVVAEPLADVAHDWSIVWTL